MCVVFPIDFKLSMNSFVISQIKLMRCKKMRSLAEKSCYTTISRNWCLMQTYMTYESFTTESYLLPKDICKNRWSFEQYEILNDVLFSRRWKSGDRTVYLWVVRYPLFDWQLTVDNVMDLVVVGRMDKNREICFLLFSYLFEIGYVYV